MRATRIYKNQTAVRLVLDTDVDLSIYGLATSGAKVGYKKPDGTTGQWQGAVLSDVDGTIYLDFSPSVKFDVVGDWSLWAELTFADNRTGFGKVKVYQVIEKGVPDN